jgi:hypothetical protein
MMQVPAQSQPAAPVDNEVSLAGSGVATTTSKLQAENDGAEDGEVQQEDDSTDKTSISANETSNNGKHSEHQSPMEATVDEEDEDDEILEDSSGNGSEKDEVNDFRSIGDIPAINLKQEVSFGGLLPPPPHLPSKDWLKPFLLFRSCVFFPNGAYCPSLWSSLRW